MNKDLLKALIPASEEGMCTLQLTPLELQALLDVLRFAYDAAVVLNHRESKEPMGGKVASAKMQRMVDDSKDLMTIVYATMKIGEPLDGEIH